MAQRAIIEVVARFKDEASKGMKETAKNADNTKSKLDAVAGAAAKLGKMNPKLKLDADDRASSKITKAMDKARAFASKTYSVAVQLKDKITAPLQRIKDSLFSIKTLAVAIGSVFAANKLISSPVAVADAYSSTKIGFSTLLGDERGQQMMDQMDDFAKKTPFKTSNVIDNAQKMMAYGWDAERILTDMETIGNAAAATGKMDQGLESIVYALSEIRSKGKLSTQELNQLASAGIKAKQYLAQGLGYGTSDEGMMKLAADLEKGTIGANAAIEMILEGMKENGKVILNGDDQLLWNVRENGIDATYFGIRNPLCKVLGSDVRENAGILAFDFVSDNRKYTVELALDRGFLKGGFRMNLMIEVEVELKSGSDEAAVDFARSLATKYGLVQERNSKYIRALSLTGRI